MGSLYFKKLMLHALHLNCRFLVFNPNIYIPQNKIYVFNVEIRCPSIWIVGSLYFSKLSYMPFHLDCGFFVHFNEIRCLFIWTMSSSLTIGSKLVFIYTNFFRGILKHGDD